MRDRLRKVLDRFRQLGQVFVATRKVDRKLIPMMAGISLAVLALNVVVLGVLLGRPILAGVLGVLMALWVSVGVLARRATRAQYDAIEGQPGAAAAVLQTMRGTWRVTPAVAFTRKQEFVHRAIGRPGIVLVGEGSRARVTALLKQEKRKLARVAGSVPIHTVSVGNGDDQIPIDRLQNHLSRLPRTLKRGGIAALDTRLSAVSDRDLPIPKGPIPGITGGMKNLRGR